MDNLDKLVEAEERIAQLEQELVDAKDDKKSNIDTKVPAENYTNNEKNYNAKVEEVRNEIDALDTIQAVKDYNIEAQFVEVYTNEDIEEIDKIDAVMEERLDTKVKAANDGAKREGFHVKYSYDGKTYEIAIDPDNEGNRGISRTRGTGFATGFVHPLTTANSHKNDIGFFKIKLTLSGFLNEFKFIKMGESIYHKENIKVTETSMISGGGILEDLAQEFIHDAGVASKFGDLIGSQRIVEHHFELSSRKTYIRKMEFKFTDDYK